jgi:hypothetical protein
MDSASHGNPSCILHQMIQIGDGHVPEVRPARVSFSFPVTHFQAGRSGASDKLAKIVYIVLIPTRRSYLHSTVVHCTNSSDYKK